MKNYQLIMARIEKLDCDWKVHGSTEGQRNIHVFMLLIALVSTIACFIPSVHRSFMSFITVLSWVSWGIIFNISLGQRRKYKEYLEDRRKLELDAEKALSIII